MLSLGNIRHRLTVSYLAAFTVILLLFIVGASFLEYAQLTRQMVHAEIEDLETAEGLLYFDAAGQLLFNQQYHNHPQSRLLADRYMEVLNEEGAVVFRNDKLGPQSLGATPFATEGRQGYNERPVTLGDGTHLLVISHVHSIDGRPLLIRLGYSLGPVWSRVQEFALLLLSALPIALLFAGAFGYRMASQVLKPLNEMTSMVKTMTANNLRDRLPVQNSIDEVGQMATVINGLLRRLEDSFENLKRFTADASHELRTPLATIRSVGEVTLQHQRTPEQYKDAIGSMLEEGTRLTETVDALLSMSRADAGRVEINKTTFRVVDLVNEVSGLFELLADDRHQKIEVDGDSSLYVRADRILVQRALSNIVENAIKYAPSDTRISVSVRSLQRDQQSFVEIGVRDRGIPIDESLHHKIFERFYRLDSSRSRDAGGNGLGLSIAKWAIEANGGMITVSSAPNSGNTFAIHLPTEFGSFV